MVQRGSWAKRTTGAAVAAIAVTGWAILGGGGAVLASDETVSVVETTNASRQQLAGAAPLARSADLDVVAQRHAEDMATRGDLFHNPELASQVEGWRIVAENVGVGTDVGAILQAFLDSPSHRANVLDLRLAELGIGIVVGEDGRIWITEVFRAPMAPAAAPASESASVAPVAAATPVAAAAPPASPRQTPSAAPDAPAAPLAATRHADLRDAAARQAGESQAAALAEAEARATTAMAEAAFAQALVGAEADTLDLTSTASADASPVITLSAPQLVSADADPITGRPAVVLAAAMWLIVAVSLLRRVGADVAYTGRAVRRRFVAQTA